MTNTSAFISSPGKVTLVAILSFIILAYKFPSLLEFHSTRTTNQDTLSFHSVNATTPKIEIPEYILRNWAAYAPYYPVETYNRPPKDCVIDQVNVLRRHGARYPTVGAAAGIVTSLTKLKTAISYEIPELEFLKNYTYDLGIADLIAYGRAQAFDAGQYDYHRYKHLVNSANLPFVRSSSASRVVDAATNWTEGFAFSSHKKVTPSLNLILQESLNDTLDDKMCPNAGSGDTQSDIWQAIYAVPACKRLNKAAPGANLAVDDVSNLIALCAFDTLAHLEASPFCDLFELQDFEGYEYYIDLNKFYGTGYGQPLGRVQGVGYVNELLARLTGSPVRDNTQTNRTLDADLRTFPLDRAMYVDFSHDNQMIAIYSALGLLRSERARPRRVGMHMGTMYPTRPDPDRSWVMSRLVPFSGTLVVERMQCRERMEDISSSSLSESADTILEQIPVHPHAQSSTRAYVRILINDAVQDLHFCNVDSVTSPHDLCTLDDFVASQSYSRNDGNGDFEKCFSSE